MGRFYKLIDRLYNKKIDASGLGYFRIAYSIVLLCEVIQLFYFRHLVFDKIPFVEPAEIDLSYALLAWMVTILFLVFGLFTRQAAIINYLFSLVFIATIDTYEYHMFYVYMGVNFLLMFINVSQVNSLDRLRLKLKYSNTRFNYHAPRTVSVLNYHIVVLVAIGFVYFDSVFFKFSSYNWLNGLGMWLPASLPQVTHLNTSFLLNIKWLALTMGYLTLAFEAIFILTFFRKKWRVPLMILGIGLHVGIVLEFPIPWFGLGVIGLYLLMVPVSFWKWLQDKLSFKQPLIVFYYDEECPLCNRTKIVLRHFDYLGAVDFKGVQTYGFSDERLAHISREKLLDSIHAITKKDKIYEGIETYRFTLLRLPVLFFIGVLISIPGIYHLAKLVYNYVALNRNVERCTEENCGYTPPILPLDIDQIKVLHNVKLVNIRIFLWSALCVILILLQLNVTYHSKLIREVKSYLGFSNSIPDKIVQKISAPTRALSKVFLGITSHPVFMDSHFNDYNHVIGIEAEFKDGRKEWLPIIDKDGNPSWYIYSFNWVKWTFRVNSPRIDQTTFVKGARDFSTFWLVKNGYDVNDLKFNVYLKKIDIPIYWEYNFLKKQESKPWKKIGEISWSNNGEFVSDLPEIEKL